MGLCVDLALICKVSVISSGLINVDLLTCSLKQFVARHRSHPSCYKRVASFLPHALSHQIRAGERCGISEGHDSGHPQKTHPGQDASLVAEKKDDFGNALQNLYREPERVEDLVGPVN